MVSNEVIKDIVRKNDIVDVISDYVDLTPKSNNFWGLCPFHEKNLGHADTHASMCVSRDKQYFKCYSCGASGNVISFIMEKENINFLEAVSILGRRVGIEIDNHSNYQKRDTKFDKYYDIYKTTNDIYKLNLYTEKGKDALNYLYNRKMDDDLIKRFGIGLSLDNEISSNLVNKYNPNDLVNLGLCKDYYGLQDLYKNRIMFPIKDLYGNIVAYSGRRYIESDEAKYINTKETVIFKKSKILYNYSDAKDEIKRKNEIIICEGFMEVIRLYSAKIYNVIALMGTNLSKEQFDFIKKLNVNIVLNLDNDEPGKLATIQIGNLLSKHHIDCKVVTFDKYKDTDELIMNDGEEAFIKAYNNRVSFIDFKLNYIKKRSNLNDSAGKMSYINDAINAINMLDDDILKELKIRELASEFNISKDNLNKQVKYNNEVRNKQVNVKMVKKKYDKYLRSEMSIIFLMFNHEEIIKLYSENLGFLIHDNMKNLANEIVYFKEKNRNWDYSEFYTYILNHKNRQELESTLKEVLENNHKEDYTTKEIEDYFNVIKEYQVNKQIDLLTKKITETLDIEEKKRLAQKIVNMKKDVLKW